MKKLLLIFLWYIVLNPHTLCAVTQYQDNGSIVPSGGNVGITGNLGVGTTDPTVKLRITGGLTALEQPSFTAVTFQNSWANYGGGYQTGGYLKDSFGVVHLKGLIANGTWGAVMFTLPAGYRPTARLLFSTLSATGLVSRIDILTDGTVVGVTGANGWISLDGISFRAEQ